MDDHPYGPVIVQVEVNLVAQILALLAELSQDLRAELDARYTGKLDQPTSARRYSSEAAGCTLADQMLAHLHQTQPHLFRSIPGPRTEGMTG